MRTQIIRQRSLRPSVDYYSKKLHDSMQQLFRNAIKAYIEAIVPAIAIDTGMSRASLIPMARAVRMVGKIRSQITPRRESRKGLTNMSGSYDPEGVKNVAAGEQAGQKAFKILYGSYKRPVMSFSFSINVYQYWLHENGFGGGQSWRTFDKGREAVLSYIKEHSASFIPRITELIK